jgi:hypothetical protein
VDDVRVLTAFTGDINQLEYVTRHAGRRHTIREVYVAAVASGNVEMVVQMGTPLYGLNNLASVAARYNRMEMLRHLTKTMIGIRDWKYYSHMAAAVGNHVDVFVYLTESQPMHTYCSVIECTNIFRVAVRHGSTDVLRWILSHLRGLVNWDKLLDHGNYPMQSHHLSG